MKQNKNIYNVFIAVKRVRLSPSFWLTYLIYVKQVFLCVSHNKLQMYRTLSTFTL